MQFFNHYFDCLASCPTHLFAAGVRNGYVSVCRIPLGSAFFLTGLGGLHPAVGPSEPAGGPADVLRWLVPLKALSVATLFGFDRNFSRTYLFLLQQTFQ